MTRPECRLDPSGGVGEPIREVCGGWPLISNLCAASSGSPTARGIPDDGEVLGVILEGLARLEYRGYDLAGLALVGAPGEDGIWRARRPTGPGPSTIWSSGPKVLRAGPAPESATPGGPPTAARPRPTPILISTARAGWPSSTTGSSRTTSSWGTAARRRAPLRVGDRHRSPGPSDRVGPGRHPDAGLVGAVRVALGRIRAHFRWP